MSAILEYVHHIRYVITQKEAMYVLVYMDIRWKTKRALVS